MIKTFCALLLMLLAQPCLARQASAMAGYFKLEATKDGKSGSVSNLGYYKLGLQNEVLPHLALAINYTLFMSKTLGGDLGYGPELIGLYYPFSDSKIEKQTIDNVSYVRREQFRPFVGMGFCQRNFQSVQSSYAGFGFTAGVDYAFSDLFDLRGELNTMSLLGPNSIQASETSLLLGIQVGF